MIIDQYDLYFSDYVLNQQEFILHIHDRIYGMDFVMEDFNLNVIKHNLLNIQGI